MNASELVDDLYAAFASSLGEELAEHARDLPRALRLAPTRNAPWSTVFAHEVTLGAPALFAEAMPSVNRSTVRDATLAHMLGVIEAFGTDRIEDGQIRSSSHVMAVLANVRRERDAACARVLGAIAADAVIEPSAADWVTSHAIATEKTLLSSHEAVGFKTYESVALAKQTAGLVASVALARAAGWSPRRRMAVRRALESVALGLQMHDDVVDWEEDQARGGSWAVALLRGTHEESGEDTRSESLRTRVLRSGVLNGLLRRARWHMRSAAYRAGALGATRLAAWARGREARLSALVDAESRSPGYAVRAHALSAWAAEVLA